MEGKHHDEEKERINKTDAGIEDELKSNIKDEHLRGENQKNRRIIDHAVSIAVSIILLFIFNSLLSWRIPFLTGSYIKCLWAIDLSIGSTIIANFVLLFYEKEWFRHLMHLFLDIFAMIAAYSIYSIFPFSFTEKVWQNTTNIVLIVILIVTGFSIIYEIIKIILALKLKK
jgi:hypothetical protein